MATKQQKAIQRAVKSERKRGKIREEKHILWFLIALVLLLLYLLFAQHYDWWPYRQADLGTAFYTNISSTAPKPASLSTTAGETGSSNTGAGASSSTGSGTTGTSSSGSSSTPPASTTSNPSIAGLAAGINVGDTKTQVSSQANGLGQNCAIIVSESASLGGQQQVCTYTQGDKIVTVTYLNGQVISASKSGF